MHLTAEERPDQEKLQNDKVQKSSEKENKMKLQRFSKCIEIAMRVWNTTNKINVSLGNLYRQYRHLKSLPQKTWASSK